MLFKDHLKIVTDAGAVLHLAGTTIHLTFSTR